MGHRLRAELGDEGLDSSRVETAARDDKGLSLAACIRGGNHEFGEIAPGIETGGVDELIHVRFFCLQLIQEELAEARRTDLVGANSSDESGVRGQHAEQVRIGTE